MLVDQSPKSFTCVFDPNNRPMSRCIRMAPYLQLDNIETCIIRLDTLTNITYNPSEMVKVLGIDIDSDILYHPYLATNPDDEQLFTNIKIVHVHLKLKNPIEVDEHVLTLARSFDECQIVPLEVDYMSYTNWFTPSMLLENTLHTIPYSIYVYLRNKVDRSIIIPKSVMISRGSDTNDSMRSIYVESDEQCRLDQDSIDFWTDKVGIQGSIKFSIKCLDAGVDECSNYDLCTIMSHKARLYKPIGAYFISDKLWRRDPNESPEEKALLDEQEEQFERANIAMGEREANMTEEEHQNRRNEVLRRRQEMLKQIYG